MQSTNEEDTKELNSDLDNQVKDNLSDQEEEVVSKPKKNI